MIEFKSILTDDGYLDYHVYNANEGFTESEYLGRIINYEWTGEWLFQSPMKSVVMTLEEMKEVVAMMNKLSGGKNEINEA